MASIKNKSLKKSLATKAEENATVTKGSKNNSVVLKEGIPCDHSTKHFNSRTVGVNVGVTLNMEDYNSLRVDVWLTDEVSDNETFENAQDRIVQIADKKLQELVSMYSN